MTTVLVVDDVAPLAEQYAYDLKRVGGYATLVAAGGREALELLGREAVDCIVLDLEMPGMDGFDVLRAIGEQGIRTPVIVYTGTGSYDRCIQAIRLGAYGFIDKAEPMERVVREIENTLERERLRGEVASLRRHVGQESPLVGKSRAMEQLRARIARLAPIPSPVLIVGESGSGKELVARELHRLSKAGSGPFLAINSAALPENLIESELFGHERGAFTGATGVRKGAFEAASGGTLFLDEIGDLPAGALAKLLRVLEERQVTRVGGNRTVTVDARVLAATNRNLEQEVEAGRFREDLLYRINAHVLRVPPLRERLSDVPDLVGHLLAYTCARFGMRAKTIDSAALAVLQAYDWSKNNVRELRNIVERLVIACAGDRITTAHITPEIRPLSSGDAPHHEGRSFKERKAAAERGIVLQALERNDWHVTRAADDLGLADHASLLKIMRRHGITSRRAE
ncbi:MAG: sigma-54 dependent transcriptional regulator [Gemmatimonadales bacterium]